MFKFWVAAHCPKTKKAKPVTVGADVTVNESFLGQICTVCTVSSRRDKLGFYADIQVIFGTGCAATEVHCLKHVVSDFL